MWLCGTPYLSEKHNIPFQSQVTNVKVERRNTMHADKCALTLVPSYKHYHRNLCPVPQPSLPLSIACLVPMPSDSWNVQ